MCPNIVLLTSQNITFSLLFRNLIKMFYRYKPPRRNFLHDGETALKSVVHFGRTEDKPTHADSNFDISLFRKDQIITGEYYLILLVKFFEENHVKKRKIIFIKK